jgi:hypothetical protein
MDDLNDPRISAYKPQRRILLPRPPGMKRKPSAAQRKAAREQEARAAARISRMHLVGLTSAGVVVMGLVLVAVLVMLLVGLAGHH